MFVEAPVQVSHRLCSLGSAALWSMCVLSSACATTEATVREEPVTTTDLARAPLPLDSVVVEELRYEAGESGLAYVDGRTGKSLSYDDVVARMRAAQVILVGEQHDQATHHRLQARVIDSLGSEPGLVVGLEMVPWSLQEPLERFHKGEIDADGLAGALTWEETWGYDFELYRPVFDAGRSAKARFVALNAPRDVVRALAKNGVDGLAPDVKDAVPELDLTDVRHREDIFGIFKNHHPPTGHGSMEKAFERFYLVQVLWDESMADRTSRALDDGAKRVIVLAGNGHVAGYRGIPNRIARRKPTARIMTLVPITLGTGEDAAEVIKAAVAEGEADVIAVVRPREVLAI
jgi:uncharacterized iron-regulated protein